MFKRQIQYIGFIFLFIQNSSVYSQDSTIYMYNTYRLESNYSLKQTLADKDNIGMGIYIGHHFRNKKSIQWLFEFGFIQTKHSINEISYGTRIEKNINDRISWYSLMATMRVYPFLHYNFFTDFSLLLNIPFSGHRKGYYSQYQYTHFGVFYDEGNFEEDLTVYGINILPGFTIGYNLPVKSHQLFLKSGFNLGFLNITEEKWGNIQQIKNSYFNLSIGFTL